MGTHRIEITQDTAAPGGITAMQVAQHFLNYQLGASIGVGSGKWVVFSKWQPLRITINRSGRTEDEGSYITLFHRFQQAKCPDYIIVIVCERLFNRLPNRLEAGEVNYRIRAATTQGRLQHGTIPNVALYPVEFPACNTLHPRQCLGMTIGKIVKYGNIKTCVKQLNAGMRTDITRSAGDKNHRIIFTAGLQKN